MPGKLAQRSRSEDPLQEHLRQRKSEWNAECSAFIARINKFKPYLIAFKRGLNGRGDAKAGLPVSNIKDPLPSEVVSFLGGLGSEFNDLASTFADLTAEAGGIAQEQAQYSAKRRHGGNPQQRRANEEFQGLIAEGSNPITRFWAHLSSIFSSKENKNLRLTMLSMTHKLFRNLIDLEDIVLERGTQNIPKVLNAYFLVSNNVNALFMSLESFKKASGLAQLPEPAPQKENKTLDTPAPEVQKVEEEKPVAANASLETIANNIKLMKKALGLSSDDYSTLANLFSSLRKEKNANKRDLIQDRIFDVYKEVFDKVKKQVEEKSGHNLPSDISLDNLIIINKNAFSLEEELEKFANPIGRFFNSLKHQFGKKDLTSASRLEIHQLIRGAKKASDKLMNLLERKNVDVNEVINAVKEVNEIVSQMSEPIKILSALHKDKYYSKDHKHRDVTMDPINRLYTRKLRRDVDTSDW